MSTGDVGHLDAGGRLFVDGRDDEMIVSGGENVFPREVEDLLADHDEIEEAAVVGVPDAEFGQRLRAYVVPRAGAGLSEQEVKDYVKQNLARYKVPRDVVFLDQLPRNATGKIVKRELCSGDRLAASAGSAGQPRNGAARGPRTARGRRAAPDSMSPGVRCDAREDRGHPSAHRIGVTVWLIVERQTALARRPSLAFFDARLTASDLASLRLTAGEGRRLELRGARSSRCSWAGSATRASPPRIPVVLEVSRMTGGGYALRLRFSAAIAGPCMRCLGPAEPAVEVDAREVDRPGGGEELQSPYVSNEVLDLAAWARDAFALAMPAKVLCREDCRGCARSARPTSTRPGPSTATISRPTRAGRSCAS